MVEEFVGSIKEVMCFTFFSYFKQENETKNL